MIENHRTGPIRSPMRRCEPLIDGLRIAGFDGGLIDETPATPGRPDRPAPSL